MDLPLGSSADAPVTTALSELVATGRLNPDSAQQYAAQSLDRIARELARPAARGLLGRFAAQRQVKGAYLVGSVGRGKTMLMDLFFTAAGGLDKRRQHFVEFMDEIHSAIAAFRATPKGKSDDADPIAAAVRSVLPRTRLLCLDEFQVQDITDAMLLGRLFDRLFDRGVTLVATSNTPPGRLYENGLNRDRILPFIARLEAELEIVPLDGPTDYRRQKFAGQQVFWFGSGPQVATQMDALWLRLTGGSPGEPTEVESLGRRIPVSRAGMGAARFSFSELCEVPLGGRDYLRLAHAFGTLMVDAIPRMDETRTDASRRFTILIDTLYDRGVRLAASFAVPLEQLAGNAHTRAEFARTISRLMEMQSAAYLEAARKDGAGRS